LPAGGSPQNGRPTEVRRKQWCRSPSRWHPVNLETASRCREERCDRLCLRMDEDEVPRDSAEFPNTGIGPRDVLVLHHPEWRPLSCPPKEYSADWRRHVAQSVRGARARPLRRRERTPERSGSFEARLGAPCGDSAIADGRGGGGGNDFRAEGTQGKIARRTRPSKVTTRIMLGRSRAPLGWKQGSCSYEGGRRHGSEGS